jgi:Domain of unknown function (DUF397)
MSKTEEQDNVPGWRKSSYSISNGACVETAAVPGTVIVRDSVSPPDLQLRFGAGAWQEFTARIKGALVTP